MRTRTRIVGAFIALLMLAGMAGAFASPASAGDATPAPPGLEQIIEHNDKIYTYAEADKLTKAKQDKARLSGARTTAGCYDWYLIDSKNIGGPWTAPNMGVLRVWWNSCRSENKARTEHVGSYIAWGTTTGVLICPADNFGNCNGTQKVDVGFYAYYAGDVFAVNMSHRCLRATGSMVANRSDGKSYGTVITGHCG
jgi:hypothetical protein